MGISRHYKRVLLEIIGYVMAFEVIYVGASIGICWDDLGAIYMALWDHVRQLV